MRSEIRLEEGFINNSSCAYVSALPAFLRVHPPPPSLPIHIARVPHPRVDRAIVKLSGTLELCTLSFEMGRGRKLKGAEGERAFRLRSTP